MNPLDEMKYSLCRQAQYKGSEPTQVPEQPELHHDRRRTFVTRAIVTLGSHIKEWASAAGSQGYLPNLHID